MPKSLAVLTVTDRSRELSMARLWSPVVANEKSPPLAVILSWWGGLLSGFWPRASGRTGRW